MKRKGYVVFEFCVFFGEFECVIVVRFYGDFIGCDGYKYVCKFCWGDLWFFMYKIVVKFGDQCVFEFEVLCFESDFFWFFCCDCVVCFVVFFVFFDLIVCDEIEIEFDDDEFDDEFVDFWNSCVGVCQMCWFCVCVCEIRNF